MADPEIRPEEESTSIIYCSTRITRSTLISYSFQISLPEHPNQWPCLQLSQLAHKKRQQSTGLPLTTHQHLPNRLYSSRSPRPPSHFRRPPSLCGQHAIHRQVGRCRGALHSSRVSHVCKCQGPMSVSRLNDLIASGSTLPLTLLRAGTLPTALSTSKPKNMLSGPWLTWMVTSCSAGRSRSSLGLQRLLSGTLIILPRIDGVVRISLALLKCTLTRPSGCMWEVFLDWQIMMLSRAVFDLSSRDTQCMCCQSGCE